MSLYPQAAPTGALVSMKAGKCEMKLQPNGKYLITPELQKGLLTVTKEQDQLHHIKWQPRGGAGAGVSVEDDRILLEGSGTFRKVATGRPEDRVYLLQMGDGSDPNPDRFFYWCQEKDSALDEEKAATFDRLATDPDTAESPWAEARGGAQGEANMANDLQSILLSMGYPAAAAAGPAGEAEAAPASAEEGGGGGADAEGGSAVSPTAAEGSAGGAGAGGEGGGGGGLTAEAMQRAINGAMMNMAARDSSGAGQQQGQGQVVPLNDLVIADDILETGVLDDPEVQAALVPLLAEGQQNEAELREIMRSPQLQQSLSSLTAALQSDNFNGVLQSFGLDHSAPGAGESLARGDGVDALLKALLHAARLKKEKEEKEKGEGEGGAQDEEMKDA